MRATGRNQHSCSDRIQRIIVRINDTMRKNMFLVQKSPIPSNSLLNAYTTNEAYADAYSIEMVEQISLPEYIFLFYTTALFKLERFILRMTIAKSSTDSEARQLADGDIDSFAAWRVESRRDDEILLYDISGRTRSWLMLVPIDDGNGSRTRLYFGSAVVPVPNPKTGSLSLGGVFRSLMPFHRMYSVLLLYLTELRIRRGRRRTRQTKEFINE